MAKTKSTAAKTASDAQVKPKSSVKEGAVTKPSQTPKSKSKEIAKQVALKVDKATKGDKKSKKAKKEPTPPPEPSSSESESDAEDSPSSVSSDDESGSDMELSKPTAKSNGVKTNGAAKAAAKVEAESSQSSESSDSEDDGKQVKPVPELVPAVANTNGAGKPDNDSEDSDNSDDSDGSDDEEDVAVSNIFGSSKAVNDAPKTAGSEASSEEDSDDSGSESDSEEESSAEEAEEAEEANVSKKRKADTDAVPAAKKSKTETASEASGQKNLFVGQLSWNVDEDWLAREFGSYGELSSVRVIMDKASGRSKGFGYVEFVNPADAVKAQKALHGTSIDNRAINVDFSTPRADAGVGGAGANRERSKTYGDQRSPPSDTLFVANIAFEATEDIIGEEFGKHGSVIGVRLPTNPEDGNPKGFGYVQYASVEEATEALDNMAGASICGRPIRLDFSTPRANNNGDSPRGGGRGGGRGRGGFDRGGRGGGRGRGGFDRGGRGGGRGSSTNRGGFGDFKGKKMTF